MESSGQDEGRYYRPRGKPDKSKSPQKSAERGKNIVTPTASSSSKPQTSPNSKKGLLGRLSLSSKAGKLQTQNANTSQGEAGSEAPNRPARETPDQGIFNIMRRLSISQDRDEEADPMRTVPALDIRNITAARTTMARAFTAVDLMQEIVESRPRYPPRQLMNSGLPKEDLEVLTKAREILFRATQNVQDDPAVREYDDEYGEQDTGLAVPIWALAMEESRAMVQRFANNAQNYEWPEGMTTYDSVVRS